MTDITPSLRRCTRNWGPGLIRYLRRLLQHSGGLAEDIAQDSFLILARRWPEVRNHPCPRAYLYTVARRLVFDTLQERSREFLQRNRQIRRAPGQGDPSDRYNDN